MDRFCVLQKTPFENVVTESHFRNVALAQRFGWVSRTSKNQSNMGGGQPWAGSVPCTGPRPWTAVGGRGRTWTAVAGSGQPWSVDGRGRGRPWAAEGGRGRPWTTVDSRGRWTAVGGGGWLRHCRRGMSLYARFLTATPHSHSNSTLCTQQSSTGTSFRALPTDRSNCVQL